MTSRAHVAQRDRDFNAMLAAIAAARRAQHRRIVLARFSGVCDLCGTTIEVGAKIAWRPNARATHAECFVGEVRT